MPDPSPALPEFLRARDRRVVAALVALAGAALLTCWAITGGPSGRWVDAKRLPELPNRFQVDLNAAGASELAAIPEVGPALAARIIEYRKAHGAFRSHDDLLEVRGIGRKTLERMQPYLAPIERQAPPE